MHRFGLFEIFFYIILILAIIIIPSFVAYKIGYKNGKSRKYKKKTYSKSEN